MSDSRKVTALIVTYLSRETISHTLDALYPAFECGYASCVVVDNASSDGTADFVAERYPWVKLVRSPENLGFGRGNNLGFKSVETPYLLFLNPDASIKLDGLKVLVEFLESHSKAGIVGPATLILDKGYQYAGKLLTPMRLIRTSLGFGAKREEERVIEPGGEPFQTTWICGAVFMIRSSLFRELGGFDPRFFLYYEETDLCLRTLRSDYEIWAVGEASSEHHCGFSAKRSGEVMTSESQGTLINKHFFESRYYYMKKNFGWFSATAAELVSTIMDWIRWQSKTLRQRGEGQRMKPSRRPLLKLPKRVELMDED
jgi:GT2 family glycosyltransferase